MNAAHLHLVINHLPFAGFLFGFAALVVGWIGRNSSLKRFALGTFAVAGALGAAAYFSGNAAEEANFGEGSPFRAEVERHEESAEATWIVGAIVGAASIVVLAVTRRMSDVPAPFTIALSIGALVCTLLLMKTANLGGQIQHSEIRSDQFTKLINPRR